MPRPTTGQGVVKSNSSSFHQLASSLPQSDTATAGKRSSGYSGSLKIHRQRTRTDWAGSSILEVTLANGPQRRPRQFFNSCLPS
ncbi:hypothetical protein RE6C_01040 [Rhodopirellula europaea 6C]|uniref:Uncharacterized protein n=1 Tax=Rhodopirellula europaea 6C TaxID=1263867 RepID=M2A8K3_9BACT|nr:hypothetical protein RE6C_01040 [Rhodopirellula europaea 6C]